MVQPDGQGGCAQDAGVGLGESAGQCWNGFHGLERWTPTGGTPQGAVISPLLANLFLHDTLGKWMSRRYPHIPFERYADTLAHHRAGPAAAGRRGAGKRSPLGAAAGLRCYGAVAPDSDEASGDSKDRACAD